MSGINKFIQFDPTGANMETDAAYAADSQRSGGAISGPSEFASILANKLFYQISTMVAALGQAIADGGHDANDSALIDLVTAIEATWAKLNGDASQAFSAANGSTGKQVINISQFTFLPGSGTGYLILPGGYIRQFGITGSVAAHPYGSTTVYTVTFPIAFPTAFLGGNYVAILNDTATPDANPSLSPGITGKTQMTICNNQAIPTPFYWWAEGY